MRYDHVRKDTEAAIARAMASDLKPDEALLQRTKAMMREKIAMQEQRRYKPGRWVSIAATLLIMVAMTALTYAAWSLLSPDQVADHLGRPTLQQAFQRPEALLLNEIVESDKYRVTLLGLISGRGLDDWRNMDGLEADESYVVLAIERTDGTIHDFTDPAAFGAELYFSPLVQGYRPHVLNSFVLGAGGSRTIIDGVEYVIFSVRSLEIFADKTVYLWVSSGIQEHYAAINYDMDTGEMSAKEEYEGLNVLFTLPLNPENADPEQVRQLIYAIYGEVGPPNPTQEEIDAAWAAAPNTSVVTVWLEGDEDADIIFTATDIYGDAVSFGKPVIGGEDTGNAILSDDEEFVFVAEMHDEPVYQREFSSKAEYVEWMEEYLVEDEASRAVLERYLRYFDTGISLMVYKYANGIIAVHTKR